MPDCEDAHANGSQLACTLPAMNTHQRQGIPVVAVRKKLPVGPRTVFALNIVVLAHSC
jgi:hypothetical protein